MAIDDSESDGRSDLDQEIPLEVLELSEIFDEPAVLTNYFHTMVTGDGMVRLTHGEFIDADFKVIHAAMAMTLEKAAELLEQLSSAVNAGRNVQAERAAARQKMM